MAVVDASRIADPATRTLVRELAELRREVDTLKAGQRASQLGNSSVDNGTLWFTDNGVQRVGIGAQVDGKFGWFAVNGAAPPRPNTPQLSGTVNGVAITWNGEFFGPAPSDFTHVKVYVSPVGQAFIPSEGNVVGHFLGAATMPVAPLPETDHWCVLIAYNTSGVPSEPSFVAGPARPQPVVATEILDGIVTETKLAANAVTQAKLAAGSVGTAQIAGQAVDLSKLADGSVDATKIVDGSISRAKLSFTVEDIASIATYFQPSQPTGDIRAGSLWADSDDRNRLYRYTGSAWVEMSDLGVQQALAAAQQAQTDAASAVTRAAGAEAIADGKVDVFFQPESPSGASTGDLWLDTDDGNKLYRWSGAAWVVVSDARIATALANAQTAQSTADRKIQAFYRATAPTVAADNVGVGDLWYNTASGNAVSRWNGTAWTALPLGSAALADNSIVAAKLASGAVTLGKLADGSVSGPAIVTDAVTAEKIASGAVGSGELATGSVIAGKVAANTIGANELIANSIVAGKLAADSVTSTNIVAGSVQTGHLAAGSVSTEKLVAASVIAEKIAALAVTADKLAANSVTAGAIQAGSITADKLEALLVLANTIIAGDPTDWHLELGDSQTPILYWNNDETGFAVSRDQTTGQANVYMSGRVEFGNGSQIEQDYLDLCEQPATGFQMPTLRQSRTLIYSNPVSTLSPQPSWLSATGKGNLLHLSVTAANTAGTGAPTITVPATWQLIRTQTGGATGSTRMTTYQIPGSAHTASRTKEAISANVACAWSVGMVEAVGIQPTSPLDVHASASGTGSTASTGTTGVPAQGNEFQIATFGTPGAGSAGKSGFGTPTNGFSVVTQGGGFSGQGSATATRIVTGALAASSTAPLSSSQPWLGMISTFRTALAAAIPNTPPAKVVRLYSRPVGGASTPHILDSSGATYPVGRTPYCRVRLNSPSTPSGGPGPGFYVTANTDIYAQGDWSISADPYNMASISTSGATFSNITVPVTGYYMVDFRTIFQASAAPGDNAVVAFVTANGRTAGSNSVARDARGFQRYGVGDLTPVQATRIVPLNAGDILYWGSWSNVNCYVLNGAALPTEIAVFYLGMSA